MKPSGPPGASGSSVSSAFRSAPAQNALVAGAGEHEHARVVVGAKRSKASRSASAVAPSTALWRSGRSIVTSAAAPRRS